MTLQYDISNSIRTNLLKLIEKQHELDSAVTCRNV
jgi:hypothetical protein